MSSTIWLLIVGAVAGWLAGSVVKGHGFGIWVDMIVGVIGAYIGSFLLSLIGIATFGLIGQLISSFIGAVVLVSIIRMFSGNRMTNRD